MIRFLYLFLLLSVSACSAQKPYPGVIFLHNPCHTPVSVSVTQFSGYISPVEGDLDAHFTLAINERKPFAQFQLSSNTQDIEWLFSDKYGGGFTLAIDNGQRKKVSSGREVFPLLKDFSEKGKDFIYLEINSPQICP